MVCPFVQRSMCHAARDHYIQNHMHRYVSTLMNKEYKNALKLSDEDSRREISELNRRRLFLQTFDEIVDGKRRKRSDTFLTEIIEDMKHKMDW